MPNIFKQAKQLLDKTAAGAELNEEDRKVWGAAMALLNNPACPLPDDMAVGKCLEELVAISQAEGESDE